MVRMVLIFAVVWVAVLLGGIIFKQASWSERGKFFKWVGISLLTALVTVLILAALVIVF